MDDEINPLNAPLDENPSAGFHDHHHVDDEEDECRVCRGPAEEGCVLMSLYYLLLLL